jgi:hypothetical protein
MNEKWGWPVYVVLLLLFGSLWRIEGLIERLTVEVRGVRTTLEAKR